MICAITQPTFLPWIGWFDIADQCDTLVLLDDVQFSKRSWQQRNRIRTPKGLEFLTVPVATSGLYTQKIMDCRMADSRILNKINKTLHANYARAPYYDEVMSEFVHLTQASVTSGRLLDLNCAIIAWLAGKLGVTSQIVLASELGAGGQRSSHLFEICECVGADRYLSTVGAESYLQQDKAAFDHRYIRVDIHVYDHPVYPQQYSPFIPYASAIDLIFNVGGKAREIMGSGRRTLRRLNNILENY